MTTTHTGLAVRPAFFPATDFPELAQVRASWREIADEGERALSELGESLDMLETSWILPLEPEDEDRHNFGEDVYQRARALAPTTDRLLAQVPYVIASAFSLLVTGKTIERHTHFNPYLTALLCLRGGAACRLEVGGEHYDFVDGEIVVFDYRLPHGVVNRGDIDRLALLMLIDPR